MPKTVKYYFAPGHNKIICTTQRTASVSMVEALKPAWDSANPQPITPADVLHYRNRRKTKVLLWIRYPFERLASAFTIFGRKSTFEKFIGRVLTETNPHWSPIVNLHTYHDIFLPNHIYTFEGLEDTWTKELPDYPLDYWNRSEPYLPWGEISSGMDHGLLKQLHEHFRYDFDLYRWALENGVHKVAA